MGVPLVGAAIGWTSLANAWPGFSSGPFSALLLGSAAAVVVGRVLATVHRTLVPSAIVVGAVLLAVATPDLLSGASLGGPLGYANANGALFVQAAMASLMLAAASRTTAVRALGLLSAGAFGIVPFAAKSVTSGTLLVLLPAIALLTRALAGARTAVAVCAALFVVTVVATSALGVTYAAGDRSSLAERVVDASIDERRVALWHEAITLMVQHPASGVGIGGFQVLSPTARADRDARWAHNSFLQQGAETGLIGLVLLTLLFLWGFASLGLVQNPDVMDVLGAVALAALGIHACVDYILHFPAIPITAAALVGAARSPR